jgi:hypothetical protein
MTKNNRRGHHSLHNLNIHFELPEGRMEVGEVASALVTEGGLLVEFVQKYTKRDYQGAKTYLMPLRRHEFRPPTKVERIARQLESGDFHKYFQSLS